MFETMETFATGSARTAVALPFALEEFLDGWTDVRRAMRRAVPPPFTRDEWAYLMAFAGPQELRAVFSRTFGEPAPAGPADALMVPRGPIAVWLPNNVTLLGPLLTVLLSLTGTQTALKIGSRAEDLTGPFVAWLREHAPDGPLGSWVRERVQTLELEHDDPRNAALAHDAAVRIAFGSEEGVQRVEELAHPVGAQGFAFGDRRSEAWVSPALAAQPAVCETLVRVFAIYGQAGCTAPRRVLVIDGDPHDARALRDRLVELWPQIIAEVPAMHVASECIAAAQRAAAAGWEPRLVGGHRATVACGPAATPVVESVQSLFIAAADVEEALATAPSNLQTVGHAVEDALSERWLRAILHSRAERFVPLARMHHFGPVWDGFAYWRSLFREVELAT